MGHCYDDIRFVVRLSVRLSVTVVQCDSCISVVDTACRLATLEATNSFDFWLSCYSSQAR